MIPGFALLLAGGAAWGQSAAGFDYYITGNPDDVQRETRGLIVMQGGGDDVDANYVRMGEFGGGGDFLVLRASGEDDYNPYIYELCNCDSVQTIVFKNREAAFDPFVVQAINNAEALFIAGGDQSNYVKFWKGTPVEEAINALAARAPIGGTSAGMAILGEFTYSAMTASVTAERGMADPYYEDVTLERDFLGLAGMDNIITDQHLQERDRIGRTLTFMARLMADGWTEQARAIAADRETSLHLDPATGMARVYATADHPTPHVYFIRSSGPPSVCEPGRPLTFQALDVRRLGPGQQFDLANWRGEEGIAYTLAVDKGKLSSSRGEIY